MMEDIEILIGFLCKNKLRKIGEVILIPNFRRPKERAHFFEKKKGGGFTHATLDKQWNDDARLFYKERRNRKCRMKFFSFQIFELNFKYFGIVN